MDKKQKAIEELKKQKKLAMERLGPEGVKELEKLAKAMQSGLKAQPAKAPPTRNKPAAPSGSIPYDKKAARAAFELFLKNHGDPKEFEKRLLEMLKKSSH